MSLEFHRIAALFPLIEGEDLEEMADDIAARGLHHAITLYEGQILDGRNRYRACLMRGVEPRFLTFDPSWGSPTAWVISENAKRRHLTANQLAAVARESEKFFESEMRERRLEGNRRGGGDQRSPDRSTVKTTLTVPGERPPRNRDTARRRAAQAVGVGESQVQKAGQLQKRAPDLFERVKAGEQSLAAAHREAVARGAVAPRTSHSNGAAPVRIARPVPQVVAEQTAELSPSVRRVIEEFSTDLAIDLSMEFPALILPEWEQVCGKLRARLVRLLGAYSLAQRKEMIR